MILGLVAGALAGATADEQEFNCFISLYPIPFAPPRTRLPTPLYPRAMAGGGGVLAGVSSSAAASSSLAGDIGLVRGGSSTNRPTTTAAAAAEGEGGRNAGGYAAIEELLDTERKR